MPSRLPISSWSSLARSHTSDSSVRSHFSVWMPGSSAARSASFDRSRPTTTTRAPAVSRARAAARPAALVPPASRTSRPSAPSCAGSDICGTDTRRLTRSRGASSSRAPRRTSRAGTRRPSRHRCTPSASPRARRPAGRAPTLTPGSASACRGRARRPPASARPSDGRSIASRARRSRRRARRPPPGRHPSRMRAMCRSSAGLRADAARRTAAVRRRRRSCARACR